MLDWVRQGLDWSNEYQYVGGALVSALGTVFAAILASFTGVVTWYLTARRDRRRQEEKKLEQQRLDREERKKAQDHQERLRQERIDDIVRALHAEILTGIVLYGKQTDPVEVSKTIADLTPFATPDESDFVFASIKDELSILPSRVIHAVVAYYRVQQQTNLLIKDFRTKEFSKLSANSKRAFLTGYVQVVEILKDRGDRAVRNLSEYAKERGFGEDLDRAGSEIVNDTKASIAQIRNIIKRASQPKPGGKSSVKSNNRKNRTSH